MSNIIVKNTTSQARTGQVTVGVPLSRAFDLRFGDVLVVNNAKTGVSNIKTQWYGVGNRYDNGAYKYARVTFEVDLTASEEKTVALTKATGSTTVTELSYAPSLAMPGNIAGTTVELSIEGEVFSFPMLSLVNNASNIEGTGNKDFYRRRRHFTHLPATSDDRRRYLWVDMVVDIPARLDQCNFFFRYGYYRDFDESEPNRPEPVFNLSQDITLRVIGPRTKFRWEEYKMYNVQTVSATHKLYTLVDRSQPGADKFAAGSSNVFKGVFCYTNTTSDTAELEDPILAIAEDWNLTENYPVTGVMPEYPSYVANESDALNRSELLRDQMEARIKNPSYRGAYNWSTLVNEADTTRTGTHGLRDYAYGMRGMPILRPLNYNFIPLLEFTTRQEGLRHMFFYDTDGSSMTPTEFLNTGVLIFHSRHFWTGSTRGYSRSTESADCASVPHDGTPIYGPDRQHHTLKMCILQGFITMDWYSLEFAKMSVNNWINNNRSDTSNPFINFWEASRAAGRAYENAAFLYEFTYDQELKFYVDQNLNANLTNTQNNSPSASLDKVAHPGGTEVLRRALDFNPCGQGACLGSLEHWRPWEESAVSLGFFCVAKAFLRSQPNDSTGLRCLEIARDVSAALIGGGHLVCNTNSDKRTIILVFPSEAARQNFQDTIGVIPGAIVVTGQTSGAVGTMYLHHKEGEFGINTHRVYLNNASGTFVEGETVSTVVGASGTITRIHNFVARKSYMKSSPTNGLYRKMTVAEEEELTTDDPGNFNPAWHPMGYFKNHRLYYVYNTLLMSAPAVAKQAADGNYYGADNAQIVLDSDELISEFAVDEDNGDFDESTSRFYGYIDVNFSGPTSTTVSPSVLTSDSTLPIPTVVVETNTINAESRPVGSIPYILLTPSRATSSGTVGASDVSINVPGQVITVTPSSATPSAGASVESANTPVTITFDPQSISGIISVQNALGRIQNTFVLIGAPVTPSSPSFVHEVPGFEPGSAPPTVFNYHKVSLLETILSSGIITDYYLRFPENAVPGLVGEAIGLGGQTLRPQGYTWYVPGTTVYEISDHEVVSSAATHSISQAGRGAAIRSWTTRVGSKAIDWLKVDSLTEGIIMNEVYDTNVPSTSRLIYTPNFLGASTSLEGSEYTFVSPNRLITSANSEAGLVLEGAVTPLELVNYIPPYQSFEGSPEYPSIASYMKMYYNIAVETSLPGVSQVDSWTYHVNGIPKGEHNLSANLKLDVNTMFDQMIIYDIDTNIFSDVSALLANVDQEIRFSTDKTVVQSAAIGADPVILPSYLTAGRGAILCADTANSFVMGVVAGLDLLSDSLTNVTHITFENFATSQDETGSHRIGIASIDNYNPGAVTTTYPDGGDDAVSSKETLEKPSEDGLPVHSNRDAGWVGRRMYVVFGPSFQDVLDTIRNIHSSVDIKSTIDSEGLYPYERPAII